MRHLVCEIIIALATYGHSFDFNASSDSGIVRGYVTLSNHHFGTFELMFWLYGMYRDFDSFWLCFRTRAGTRPCSPILNVHMGCDMDVSGGRVRHPAWPHGRKTDPNRAIADEVESNALAPAQGTIPSDSRPVTGRIELLRLNKPSIDKIRKHGAEEFRANVDNDSERAEFSLENMIRVFDELSYTPVKCLKCAISLLRDIAYQWWNTLVSILELKQGRMTVTEYEREFVRLSKYAREYVSTEEIMYKRFVDGLNEAIKLLVRILDLKEFVLLADRACKVEDFNREKRKADSKARESKERLMSRPYHSLSKENQDYILIDRPLQRDIPIEIVEINTLALKLKPHQYQVLAA
ncbi:Gag-Pol polyprotein [Gossypium australe]|uniref:Gag-Pol polyprotein n=1 Tax=Gossypium australe TaxID=47621 RepID=A0A5B6X3W6_9ROSI|nr:Gag-Pol polyprotein [Gossypium australe]